MKIKLNPNNLNLKTNCYWYPCHSNVSDKDYDCRMCYCPLYQECSKLNNILWGGYLLKYTDDNNNDKEVFACDKCTVFHKKENIKYYLSLKAKGLPNEIILDDLIKTIIL
jgi:Zn-finger protein